MKIILQNIVSFILLLLPLLSLGHNPLSARYYVESSEKVSVLTINLSQDGLNSALLKSYDRVEMTSMSSKDFKELVVSYIKRNFSLEIDGDQFAIGEGGIKLGSHQTDLKFVLPPISQDFKKMDVKIAAFQENENHQTIFSYNIMGLKNVKILSEENNYKSIIINRSDQAASILTLPVLLLITIGFVILAIFNRHKKTNKFLFSKA
jgi:hypothetical protein